MNIDQISNGLEEVSRIILNFLREQGGQKNGYLTYMQGDVIVKEDNTLEWYTPNSNEKLTPELKKIKGKELYKTIQTIIKQHNMNSISIESKNLYYDAMKIEVSHSEEVLICKRVPLYRIPYTNIKK